MFLVNDGVDASSSLRGWEHFRTLRLTVLLYPVRLYPPRRRETRVAYESFSFGLYPSCRDRRRAASLRAGRARCRRCVRAEAIWKSSSQPSPASRLRSAISTATASKMSRSSPGAKIPLIDEAENGYKVSDPYHSFYGLGDPKITTKFSENDDPKYRGLSVLVIHGAGPDAWHSDTPKAKFVIINLPFTKMAVKRIKLGKESPDGDLRARIQRTRRIKRRLLRRQEIQIPAHGLEHGKLSGRYSDHASL